MIDKYEILEAMLLEVFENNTNIEKVLSEYPEYANELRPLLEAAIYTQEITVTEVPNDVMRRGRTRLLKAAYEMRERAPKKRILLFSPRWITLVAGLIFVFFIGGAGLINASASSLPGDKLYTVKRGWEQAHYWFADEDKVASLAAQHEEARRSEVQQLLHTSRLATVRFEGVVNLMDGNIWDVAGVSVVLSDAVEIESDITLGTDVIVFGMTQEDGTVLAEKIISSGHIEDHTLVPTEDSHKNESPEFEAEEIETPESEDAKIEDADETDDEAENIDTPEAEDDLSDEDEPESAETPEPDEGEEEITEEEESEEKEEENQENNDEEDQNSEDEEDAEDEEE